MPEMPRKDANRQLPEDADFPNCGDLHLHSFSCVSGYTMDKNGINPENPRNLAFSKSPDSAAVELEANWPWSPSFGPALPEYMTLAVVTMAKGGRKCKYFCYCFA